MKQKKILLFLAIAAFLPTVTFAECIPPTSSYFDLNFLEQADFLTVNNTNAANDKELYYNCDSKSFFLGDSFGIANALNAPTGRILTNAEITSLQAVEGYIYYNATTKSFVIGDDIGNTSSIQASDSRKTTAELIALEGFAQEGTFYFNTESKRFYIGLANGTLDTITE